MQAMHAALLLPPATGSSTGQIRRAWKLSLQLQASPCWLNVSSVWWKLADVTWKGNKTSQAARPRSEGVSEHESKDLELDIELKPVCKATSPG